MSEQLALRQKLADLALYLGPVVDRFPRREATALAARIKNQILVLQELAIRAEKMRDKMGCLREADVQLDLLRDMLRLARSRRYLSTRRHGTAAKRVAEIGRIIGGLMRQSKSQGARP